MGREGVIALFSRYPYIAVLPSYVVVVISPFCFQFFFFFLNTFRMLFYFDDDECGDAIHSFPCLRIKAAIIEF